MAAVSFVGSETASSIELNCAMIVYHLYGRKRLDSSARNIIGNVLLLRDHPDV